MRLLLAAALMAASAPSLLAQNGGVDEGTLLVSRNGAVVGREAFRIVRVEGGDGVYMATAQASYGTRRISPALSVSEDGRPLLYRLEARDGSVSQERVQGTVRGGRLSVLLHTTGGESARDFVLGPATLLIDHEVLHQHVFLASLLKGERRLEAVSIVDPRGGRQQRGSLAEAGNETVEIDRRPIPARHLTLTLPDGTRDVWVDARGRLLKVSIPALGIVAVREEAPR